MFNLGGSLGAVLVLAIVPGMKQKNDVDLIRVLVPFEARETHYGDCVDAEPRYSVWGIWEHVAIVDDPPHVQMFRSLLYGEQIVGRNVLWSRYNGCLGTDERRDADDSWINSERVVIGQRCIPNLNVHVAEQLPGRRVSAIGPVGAESPEKLTGNSDHVRYVRDALILNVSAVASLHRQFGNLEGVVGGLGASNGSVCGSNSGLCGFARVVDRDTQSDQGREADNNLPDRGPGHRFLGGQVAILSLLGSLVALGTGFVSAPLALDGVGWRVRASGIGFLLGGGFLTLTLWCWALGGKPLTVIDWGLGFLRSL